ncbi:MAG: CinA family protein [Lachnospiraceae bacterium]
MAIEERAAELLEKNHLTISTAESCTGGLIAGTLVNVAGISSYFNEGYVTYANAAKEKLLHVSHETLEKYGAVSPQTAEEMARGCAAAAGSNIGIASTGIAGPDGGTAEKPVGLVYIGCCLDGDVTVEKHIFNGDRQTVRAQAVEAALQLVVRKIEERGTR